MAQSNTSIFNKTGYSMFWSSMWDSKNSYNRNFKEDIFLRSFFKLAFNDSLSVNTIFFNKNNYIRKKYTNLSSLKNNDIYKYYFNVNKISTYPSKIWILKYQKWLLIYNFLFIGKFSKNTTKFFNLESVNFKKNFFYIYKNFLKLEKKNKLFYSRYNLTKFNTKLNNNF